MFWEEQLTSILESGQLDEETLADWAVAYAAETEDDCLIGIGFPFVLLLVFSDIRPGDGSDSCNSTNLMNESLSSSGSGYVEKDQSWSYSMTGFEGYLHTSRESMSNSLWSSFSCGRRGSSSYWRW